jgi:LmbE family N-acetylglucosaminyl deacetylase
VAAVDNAERDLDCDGTPEPAWEASAALQNLPVWRLDVPPSGRLIVVAPHPDDEILGCGGLIAVAHGEGLEVLVVAVTDGEASHPDRIEELRRCRPLESVSAMARLVGSPVTYDRLGHPDGGIDADLLRTQLIDRLRPGDLVLAPWHLDGHPDHDRVGYAALQAGRAAGADLVAYLVWAWHWADPKRDLPWARAVRFELDPVLTQRKRAAVRCFESQLTGPAPILPPHVLARLTRAYEVYLRP